MQTELVKLSKIKANKANPRQIKTEKFSKLIVSILVLPKMLSLRPIVVDANMKPLGGNMRAKALKAINDMDEEEIVSRLKKATDFKKKRDDEQQRLIEFWTAWKDKTEVPIVRADELTEDEQKEFVIKDNASFGEWDFDMLANEFDAGDLDNWGLDVWQVDEEDDEPERETAKQETDEEEDDEDFDIGLNFSYKDVLYDSDNDLEIPSLLPERQAGRLELPFTPWGANSRLKKDVATYHFYVDDYRFERLFTDPINLVASGCKAIVEPNCSLHDQTPIAFGLNQIYKKRYLARYMQELGVDVYADLNVSVKFIEYNKLGIPKGYNAFFTRGYDQRLESLKLELEVAREISGLETPNLIVYGGGKKVKEFCTENKLVYTEQFMGGRTF